MSTPAEQAVSEARAEWERWGRWTGVDRQAALLGYLRDGVCDKRTSTRGYQWCGAWMAWCYRHTLHPEIRAHLCPSTYRLSVAGRYTADPGIGWPHGYVRQPGHDAMRFTDYHVSHGGLRRWWTAVTDGAASGGLQPGDVALVGGPAGGSGKHIVLITSLEAGGVETLSGNGYGRRSDGTTGGGVVANHYSWSDLRRVLRWAPADHDSALVFSATR